MTKLTVEVNTRTVVDTGRIAHGGGVILITPPIDENYWLARVQVSETQAVIAFPKFGQIGIGFQFEDKDWNTNLPHTCDAVEIYNHIRINRRNASRSVCVRAIRLLQYWANQRRSA